MPFGHKALDANRGQVLPQRRLPALKPQTTIAHTLPSKEVAVHVQAQVYGMILLFAVVMASGVATAQSPQQTTPTSPNPVENAIPAPAVAPPARNLPPPPPGNSSVIGGEIRKVDPVRDEITLRLFGSNNKMTMFYDERTQVYQNGRRIDVLDLKPASHASVETTLDGTRVFALRIHMLSTVPSGECQGQVEDFNSRTRNLVVMSSLSHQTVRIDIPLDTPITRVGQKEFAAGGSGIGDLMRGSLVNVTFQPGAGGKGTATHIDVLATPGSAFTFSGQISLLDFASGRLVIIDPHDNTTYDFHFNPYRLHDAHQLHEGESVKVTAEFDGQRYEVTELTPQ